MTKKADKETIRAIAEKDFISFIRLVHPNRVLGACHIELGNWWTNPDAKSHQLTLMPRDHMKSALIGLRCAWEITRNPAIRILYISATSELAVKQLKYIKDILTSDIYRFYWPEMVNKGESQREKWTNREIAVDHPKRKEEYVRDSTVFTAGLTTSLTGLHFDVAVMDDVVVIENAYTEEGRNKVKTQYSLLSSVEGSNAREWIVGTRYHPKDLYSELMSRTVDIYNDEGDLIDSQPLFEKFERQVESRGDGTGEYLWPKQMRRDGTWFGFDQAILAKKRAQYLDPIQFRAQYYNDPNDPEGHGIAVENFQYYDRAHLSRSNGYWYYKGSKLNTFAAIDFAYSLKEKADFSSICVVGIDANRNYYVLDIDRFKTDIPSEYFRHLLALHQKWDFRKVKAECTAAQQVIVNSIKLDYIRPHGLALAIEDFRPNRNMGSKEERISAILQPKYAARQIWHYHGGHCQTLEEELVLRHPPHDDVKDSLATAIDACVAPSIQRKHLSLVRPTEHHRFGGFN